jgi:hypothetical protein
MKVVSAHLPYAVSQSQVGLAIVTPIDTLGTVLYMPRYLSGIRTSERLYQSTW